MPLIDTPDGHYTHAVTTAGEGDGNDVVYDNWIVPGTKTPVWDKFSYEAGLGQTPNPQNPNPNSHPPTSADGDVSPAPAPPPIVPSPAIGGGRVLRVTDSSDAAFVNRGYSYWSQAWISDDVIYVFAGMAQGSPRFFKVEIGSGQVWRLGPLVSYDGTGEGWYWDRDGWIYLLEGPRLRRVNPFTKEDVVVFDISADHPGCRLWQAHSSDDGQTHSATVQRIVSDGPYPNIGTVVFRHGQQIYFEAHGTLDESQITSDGAFLVIKEDDDNRIINLDTRETRLLRDADGAVGHSDCGPSVVVGEDNIHGACVLWDLRKPLTPGNRRVLFPTWGMGHVSVKGGRCLVSEAQSLALVALDGSGLMHLVDHGMIGAGYDFQVQANLDPTGRVACYLSNHGTDRLDVFLLLL